MGDGNPYCPLNVTAPEGYNFDTACVKALQWQLNHDDGAGLTIDGLYGYYTSGALEVRVGRPDDHDLYVGDTSADVTALQDRIISCGFPIAADGDWGQKTTQGLKLALNAGNF